MIRWLAILAALITGCPSACCCGDQTVSRGVAIESERPIRWLIFEAVTGVLDGRPMLSNGHGTIDGLSVSASALRIDGATQQPGLRSFAIACRRAFGFIAYDGAGSIQRDIAGRYRGYQVHYFSRLENGRIRIAVTVAGDLGDRRVRRARLTLEARDDDSRVPNSTAMRRVEDQGRRNAGATIGISCSADIDLPCDARRERVHARRQRWGCDRPTLSERIADDEAGPILAGRVERISAVGHKAVLSGRERLDAIVGAFLEDVCR